MKSTQQIMGMPVTVEIVAQGDAAKAAIDEIFEYFQSVDERFSTYKTTSEISQINRGEITSDKYSPEMKEVFKLSAETKTLSGGFFNILTPEKYYDPSGLVKGWAIFNAAEILKNSGFKNFYVEAGGDIEARSLNPQGKPWTVGIKNPFNKSEIIKVINLTNQGMATSGTYERGEHIYNPLNGKTPSDIVSLTVIGPNVYEADRFATAAFAMGATGINFIEGLDDLEGYMIDKHGTATMTSGFNKYLNSPE